MTEERNKPMDRDLDELLREALADDLPDDVAAGMRARIARFREAKAAGEATAGRRTAPPAAWAWLFRRGLWAALSALMLVAGLLLQGGKPRSPLAERIAAIKIEYSGLDTTRR